MKNKQRWFAVALYCLVIYYVSSIPLHEPPKLGIGAPFSTNDLLHLFEYMILGALTYRASNYTPFSILFSAFYGVTDELHQWFIPTRFMDPLDILVNSVGSFLGVVLMFYMMRYLFPFIQHLAGVGIHLMRYGMSPEGRQTKLLLVR